MYCKLFASLYQGTLRGRSNEILVFTNLLAHCGKDGTVDKHFRAISEETGLSVDDVKTAIIVLESPDPESRSPDENGARITRMDEHRVWGWKVVNYGKYRAIRSEEDRAEQNRLAQERWRNKNKQSKPTSAKSKRDKPKEREEVEEKENSVLWGFDEFWKLYPHKEAKSDAKKAWGQVNGNLLREQIMAGIENGKASLKWQKDGGQYIPLPATFLRGSRWEDQLQPAQAVPKISYWTPDGPDAHKTQADDLRDCILQNWPDGPAKDRVSALIADSPKP